MGRSLHKTGSSRESLLPGEYHLAVEIRPVKGRGELLIRQRSRVCDILPGVWGLTTGRVQAGAPRNRAGS